MADTQKKTSVQTTRKAPTRRKKMTPRQIEEGNIYARNAERERIDNIGTPFGDDRRI